MYILLGELSSVLIPVPSPFESALSDETRTHSLDLLTEFTRSSEPANEPKISIGLAYGGRNELFQLRKDNTDDPEFLSRRLVPRLDNDWDLDCTFRHVVVASCLRTNDLATNAAYVPFASLRE